MNDLQGFMPYGRGTPTAFPSPIGGGDVDVSPAPSSVHMGTVSPVELLLQDQYSAPNSSAFTNLTTPSNYGESPGFENYEVSPNFGDFEAGSSDNWFPLFPESSEADQLTTQPKSPLLANEELDVSDTQSSPRPKPSNSPRSQSHGRHSSVSGVNARRRDKPLPPIIVEDPNDTVAMKRARNTLAARKSRERKAQKLEELEEQIAKLVAERDHWKRVALSRPGGA
ncbi:hypothetical protein GGS20DRAFT_577141 [Poronia punctata]|nr:hypothetical protein GGS20DRAFT_577141 [Poronia punctata]